MSSEGNLRPIFEALDLSFGDGGFWAVMGPSGSGKTTLFRLLSKELEPNAGDIHIDGTSLSAIGSQELRRDVIARIYQEYLLVPYLSALDNILLAREVAGHRNSADELSRARELLSLVGLTDVGSKPAHVLSGGEQQRIAIARALCGSPRVLLADEPTGALDTQSTQRIGELLRDLAHDHGVTIIAGTHDPEFAACTDGIFRIRDRTVRPTQP